MKFLGYPLFGGALPFIGFRNFPVNNEGLPIIFGDEGERSGYNTDVFVIEWLSFGMTLFTTEIKEDQHG